MILLELLKSRDGVEVRLCVDNMMVLFAKQNKVDETVALCQWKGVMPPRPLRAPGDNVRDLR
jgi:hypothetical protein